MAATLSPALCCGEWLASAPCSSGRTAQAGGIGHVVVEEADALLKMWTRRLLFLDDEDAISS